MHDRVGHRRVREAALDHELTDVALRSPDRLVGPAQGRADLVAIGTVVIAVVGGNGGAPGRKREDQRRQRLAPPHGRVGTGMAARSTANGTSTAGAGGDVAASAISGCSGTGGSSARS